MKTPVLQLTAEGLYCPVGQFHIDAWRPVPRVVITHAHSDHAVFGCEHYLAAQAGRKVLKARLGDDVSVTALEYGAVIEHNGVRVSLHPAGHVLGSSQVRLEHLGDVVVVSGDYKLARDPTCAPFEPVRCHQFVTESTFGLPIYRWEDPARTVAEINDWWQQNREAGRASVLYAYSLGKAQRILAEVDTGIGPIVVHGAVDKMNQAYRRSGVALPETFLVSDFPAGHELSHALVIAPPSAQNSPWARRFEPCSEAVASGWMAVRGIRRRRVVDRGFVLSDHADWDALNMAVRETGAASLLVTHGSAETFAHWLREQGLEATAIVTRFVGESDDDPAEAA
jgi:putative mRNA 3-end processing factor